MPECCQRGAVLADQCRALQAGVAGQPLQEVAQVETGGLLDPFADHACFGQRIAVHLLQCLLRLFVCGVERIADHADAEHQCKQPRDALQQTPATWSQCVIHGSVFVLKAGANAQYLIPLAKQRVHADGVEVAVPALDQEGPRLV